MKKLLREDFFGHEKVIKVASLINKKTKQHINYLNIHDKEIIKILVANEDWLDFVGISLKIKDKKTIILRWEII